MSYVVYSDSETIEKVDGIAYRKLSEFYGVVTGAFGVFVDGSAPDIVDAYHLAGVTILTELPTSPQPPIPGAEVSWDSITDKPELLSLGLTATSAAAGNHNHAITVHAASGLAAAANLQLAFQAVSTRVKALEAAPGA